MMITVIMMSTKSRQFGWWLGWWWYQRNRYLITSMKEGHVLFNDALNTFYFRLYGVGHMVKDHSDSERGNSFRLAAMVLLYASSHRQDTTWLEHWLEREVAQWVHHEESIRRPIAPWSSALTTELHLAPQYEWRYRVVRYPFSSQYTDTVSRYRTAGCSECQRDSLFR